jgi:hypothetical protein
MSSTTENLKNINFMSKERYDSLSEIKDDELYAIKIPNLDCEDKITNCITEIPQDIKLELNNGTLTLKAGSKLYVPNGVDVFDTITTTSDVTRVEGSGSDFLCYYKSGTIYLISLTSAHSGSTAPTGATTMCWYDTTNNLVKRSGDSGSTWTSGFTLPFAQIKVSNGAISSIEKVFNGFGYIGSSVFALPGVKGLIPDGRNADGTLKNIEVTVNNVNVSTNTSGSSFLYHYSLYQDGHLNTTNQKYTTYDEKNNILYTSSAQVQSMICGYGKFTNGAVTDFRSKFTYRFVDYSESQWWGVPDYTAGVSITSPYVPPTNGVIIAQRTAGYSTSQIEVTSGNIIARHQSADSSSSNNYVMAIVKAGQSYTITAGSMVFYPFIGV